MVREIKQCTKCKQQKPLFEFYKEKHGEHGVRGDCKKCNIVRVQKYNHAHKTESKKCYQARNGAKRQKDRRKTIIGCLRNRFHVIKYRCNNSKAKDYDRYGGRGIKIKFKNANEFINYVINELKIDPRELQTDRINNNGHYESGNIRFVTAKVNMNNRRKENSNG